MAKTQKKKTNQLANSHSPYLLQHASNPVDWHPWSSEVFTKAESEDKPVFLSIGYSTCHWCHVMERESFADSEVAALMNDTFVCVKVDREERPDVDHLYMTVCQLLTGSGGWPLTIIMTPDRKPFFAGTYFPRDERYGRPGMLQIIPKIRELWESERDTLNESAREIAEGLGTFLAPGRPASPDSRILETVYTSLTRQYDTRYGGFGSAPKFPVFSNLLFLLRHWDRTGDQRALDMVRQTLTAMRNGGIYDQIGYGLHRYSTDEKWFAPHFEKMLYDQALAVLTWTEAFCATGEDHFREVAEEIIAYVLRDLTSPEGGFYSAEDADSEGEEGKFYTWTAEELAEVLDEEEIRIVRTVYGTSDTGNFFTETGQPTGRNILHLITIADALPDNSGTDSQQMSDTLRRIREKLMAVRAKRIKPLRDDKVMADWNGLMIAALARAAAVFGVDTYAVAAEKALKAILGKDTTGTGNLQHIRYSHSQAVPAFLDDYAYLLWGVLELYQTTYMPDLLNTALVLASEMSDLFKDRDNGGFFLTRHGSDVSLGGLKPSFDGPMPSGNAVAAISLLRLGRLTARDDLEEAAHATLQAFTLEMGNNPAGFSHMAGALELAQYGSAEVIIAGNPDKEDTKRFIRALQRSYLPAVTAAVVDPSRPDTAIRELIPYASDMRTVDGKAAAYVCREFACQAPTTDPEEMLRALSWRSIN